MSKYKLTHDDTILYINKKKVFGKNSDFTIDIVIYGYRMNSKESCRDNWKYDIRYKVFIFDKVHESIHHETSTPHPLEDNEIDELLNRYFYQTKFPGQPIPKGFTEQK